MTRRGFYFLLTIVGVACLSLAEPAWAGRAYYGGFTPELGVLAWRVVPDPAPTLYLTKMNPGWEIGSSGGTPIGALTLEDGTSNLVIPYTSDFVLTAFWDVPSNPVELTGRNCYMYIGPDFGGVDTSKTRLGIEWKLNAPETELHWHIRMQNLGVDVHAPPGISRLGVKFERIGNTCYHWYSVDGGPWTVYNNLYFPGYIPLDTPSLNWHNVPVAITFKVRGMGTHDMDPLITGPEVPDVNTTGSFDTDTDSLPDYWETYYFGTLDQGPSDDPDTDGKTNLQEFEEATNPAPLPPMAPTVTYYGAAVLLLLIVVGVTTVAVRRRTV